jgi:hypothetical protein
MMENESLRGSKNTTVIFLSLLLVGALVWAISGSVIAAKRGKVCVALEQENAQIKADAEQRLMEADRRMQEAEKLRKVALEWTRQHQIAIQEEQRKKAQEAAKAAAAKTAAPKAGAKTAKAPVKTTAKKTTRSSR